MKRYFKKLAQDLGYWFIPGLAALLTNWAIIFGYWIASRGGLA